MKNSNKTSPTNACEFCGREFRSERTLTAHSCRLKLREQSRDQPSVKLAFIAYQRFYFLTQGGVNKTWEQFRDSSYYAAFVRFATHIRDVGAINPMLFVDWLIKNKVKLDQWASDRVYGQYLEEILYTESAELAVTRSFYSMQVWADKFETNLNQYLYHAGPNRIVHDISSGNLSPWILYATKSGQEALASLNEEQLNFVIKYLDPTRWLQKLQDSAQDLEFTRMACREAGIQ